MSAPNFRPLRVACEKNPDFHWTPLVTKALDEIDRLTAILAGNDTDLMDKWLAEDGPEAHAVHLAGVEHETELGKMDTRLVAWRDTAGAWRTARDGALQIGLGSDGDHRGLARLSNAAMRLDKAARALDEEAAR